MRIALADDDPEILEQMSSYLREAGYDFDVYRNGGELMVGLKRDTYDVVLVDWNMPRATGAETIKWAMKSLDTPPAFILLTSRAEKDDIVKGLDLGASDYIVKPESENVILARIEAAARKMRTENPDRFATYGQYKVDRLSETIYRNDEPIKLTRKEFGVAALLFENLNRPLSRSYIFSKVWQGAADLETRTLDMHISRVRSKLELRPQNGFVIQTVFGFGYRMDTYLDDEVPND